MGQKQSKHDEEPKDGDLIEIYRSLLSVYQHWAVYVGDGFVVHLTSLSEVPGVGSSSMVSGIGDNAIVKKEKLLEVVGNNQWKINNSLDKKYKPHPAHDIVKQALANVGHKRPYNVITANCEHFANNMRYGVEESRQVCEAVKKVSIISLVVGFGMSLVALPIAGPAVMVLTMTGTTVAVGDLIATVAVGQCVLSGGRKKKKNTK